MLPLTSDLCKQGPHSVQWQTENLLSKAPRRRGTEARWLVKARGTLGPGVELSPLSRKSQEGNTREKDPLERARLLLRFLRSTCVDSQGSVPDTIKRFKIFFRNREMIYKRRGRLGSDSHPSLSWHLRDCSHIQQIPGGLPWPGGGGGVPTVLFVDQGLGAAAHVLGWSLRSPGGRAGQCCPRRVRQRWALGSAVVLPKCKGHSAKAQGHPESHQPGPPGREAPQT